MFSLKQINWALVAVIFLVVIVAVVAVNKSTTYKSAMSGDEFEAKMAITKPKETSTEE